MLRTSSAPCTVLAARVDLSVIAELAHRLRKTQRPKLKCQFVGAPQPSGAWLVHRGSSALACRSEVVSCSSQAILGWGSVRYPELHHVRGVTIEFFLVEGLRICLVRIRGYRLEISKELLVYRRWWNRPEPSGSCGSPEGAVTSTESVMHLMRPPGSPCRSTTFLRWPFSRLEMRCLSHEPAVTPSVSGRRRRPGLASELRTRGGARAGVDSSDAIRRPELYIR